MLIDSHCHLDRLDFTHKNLDAILLDAAEVDVNYFLCPGIDLEHFANILQIATTHKNIVISVGRHPTEEGHIPSVNELCEFGNDHLVVAVGETGLDYFYCKTENDKELQRQLFRTHIRAAIELKKPLIIHSREAATDIIAILREEHAEIVGGVMHCYTESLEMAQAALGLNFNISFSGIITFKNADKLRAVAKEIPLNKILIETDAPYLAPVPMRGKSNEPKYLPYIAAELAKLHNISVAELSKHTTENFFRMCKLFV